LALRALRLNHTHPDRGRPAVKNNPARVTVTHGTLVGRASLTCTSITSWNSPRAGWRISTGTPRPPGATAGRVPVLTNSVEEQQAWREVWLSADEGGSAKRAAGGPDGQG